MLTLKAWSNAWLEYRLDPETGKRQVRFIKDPQANLKLPIDGFESVEPIWGIWKRFYAVYVYRGRLYFQAGEKKWDVTDGVEECKFWVAAYGLCSGLILKFRTGDVLRPVLVHPLRFVASQIDPTYDAIDQEADHFFLYIRQQLPDAAWRRRMITKENTNGENAAA